MNNSSILTGFWRQTSCNQTYSHVPLHHLGPNLIQSMVNEAQIASLVVQTRPSALTSSPTCTVELTTTTNKLEKLLFQVLTFDDNLPQWQFGVDKESDKFC